MRLLVWLCAGAVIALVLAAGAAAHSSISPPVAKARTLQPFTLELQAEKEDARTTKVEARFPDGFNVETFATAPGWTRKAVTQGSGEEEHVQRVVWTGGEQSPRDDPVFRFTGTLDSAQTYGVSVRQFYDDGSVTDWRGPEGSEEPAAFVQGVSSFGGGGSSAWGIVALVVAALALILAFAALLVRGGSRPLT